MIEEEKLQNAEAKLLKLAGRLNKGWDMLHKAKDRHLEKVREAVKEQWEQKQAVEERKAKEKAKLEKETKQASSKKESKAASAKKSKSQGQDSGQSQ